MSHRRDFHHCCQEACPGKAVREILEFNNTFFFLFVSCSLLFFFQFSFSFVPDLVPEIVPSISFLNFVIFFCYSFAKQVCRRVIKAQVGLSLRFLIPRLPQSPRSFQL